MDENTATPATPVAATETPATPAPKDGTPGTSGDASAQAGAPANAAPNAAAAAPVSTAPDANASGSLSDVDDESETEREVLAVARDKAKLRAEKEKVKDKLTKAERLEKAEELVKSGDYVGAIEALGMDPDDFYVKSTDQIVKREKKVVDPAEVAREEAKKVLKEATEAQERAANEKADRRWVANVDTVLDADYDKYPLLTRALATGKTTRDDLLKYAYGCVNAKVDSSPEAVAKAFEGFYSEQQRKAKPKVTPAATPSPDAAKASGGTPVAGTNQTPPSALGSNAPVVAEVEDAGNVDENFRRALAKFGFNASV
jgi:hypothetical protein